MEPENPAYIQKEGKVVENSGNFAHIMAISLDPASGHKRGVIRCITERKGDVSVCGYVDRSEIRRVHEDSPGHFVIGEPIKVAKIDKLIEDAVHDRADFIGLEDPDIFTDIESGLVHVYFTVAFLRRKDGHSNIFLGHAYGKDIDSLEMGDPVLAGDHLKGEIAKELSIAPLNSKGFRYNLYESSRREPEGTYSTVNVAIAHNLIGPWQTGDVVFHPKEHNLTWIAGHASPGPLLPKSFIDLGPNKLLGIMNGREADRRIENHRLFGTFSVGLFVYDYEFGLIDWVSPEPLIKDSEAKSITFASQFVETSAGQNGSSVKGELGSGEGILYAHVDDSFVRAYILKASGIRTWLSKFKDVELFRKI
jgi:hypothetical protein